VIAGVICIAVVIHTLCHFERSENLLFWCCQQTAGSSSLRSSE